MDGNKLTYRETIEETTEETIEMYLPKELNVVHEYEAQGYIEKVIQASELGARQFHIGKKYFTLFWPYCELDEFNIVLPNKVIVGGIKFEQKRESGREVWMRFGCNELADQLEVGDTIYISFVDKKTIRFSKIKPIVIKMNQ